MHVRRYHDDRPGEWKIYLRPKIFYDGVLQAHKDVLANIKPGAVWTDLHLLAERSILSMLQKLNVLNESSSMEEMLENRVCAVFMPHGLGHFTRHRHARRRRLRFTKFSRSNFKTRLEILSNRESARGK